MRHSSKDERERRDRGVLNEEKTLGSTDKFSRIVDLFFVIAYCPAGGGTHNKITIHIMKNIVSKKSEDNTMATYRVKWDELSPGAKHPAHKVTTVSATSMAEAKAKVRQRIFTNVKVTSITAVKIS